MTRTIDQVCWHDMKIISTFENCETDELEMIVDEDISDDSNGTKYLKRKLVFSQVTKYVIDEGPVVGCPVVINYLLDYGETKGGRTEQITLETNAGERYIYYGHFSG